MRRLPSLPLALLLVSWSTGGCATTKPLLSGMPPQRIGIVLNMSMPPAFNVPAKGAGAGAARGAGAGLSAIARGTAGGGPAGAAVAVISLPFLVVGGAIVGALNAEAAARVEEAEAALKAALTAVKPAEVVRDRLIEVARQETSHSVVALPGPLDTEGIDTVLELTVSKCHLRGDGPINPPFRLILGLRARLIRVADGTLIHEETLEAESEKRKFIEWAEHDAQPLREGLDGVALKLAHDIVARVLAADVSSKSRRGPDKIAPLNAPPPPQAQSARVPEALAETLVGTWEGEILGEIVAGHRGPRPYRTLVITSVSMGNGLAGAFYGFKGERLGWARDASVTVSADEQVGLEFVSGVGSRISLRLIDDHLIGSFTARSTSSSTCRLSPCEITFLRTE